MIKNSPFLISKMNFSILNASHFVPKNNDQSTTNISYPVVLFDRDPSSDDDITKNFQIGTHWINTSTEEIFILIDNIKNSAVWKKLTIGNSLDENDGIKNFDCGTL